MTAPHLTVRSASRLAGGLVAALVLGVLAPAPPATALTPGSIAGVVTDEAGTSLAGIEVTVWRNVGYAEIVVGQDVTESDGSYRIDSIDPDPYYKVRFSDPGHGYATEWYDNIVAGVFATWVPVSEGGVNTLPDTQLELAGSIAGRVSVGTGTPVDHGTVTVWWRYGPQAYARLGQWATDTDGRYQVRGLPGATYAVEFKDDVSGAAEAWNDTPDLRTATPITVPNGADVTGIDALLGGVVRNLAAPSIAGVAQVGSTLTVSSDWSPAGTTVSYRWIVGDDRTPGDDPAGTTYVPVAGDLGKTIRVEATATRGAGWVPATAYSSSTAPVVAAPVAVPVPHVLVNVGLPRVKGTLRVDRIVRVTAGGWTPAPTRFAYAWYAGGKLIRTAHRQWFRLTERQAGKRLRVLVTASAPSYAPVTVRTERTKRVQLSHRAGRSLAPAENA